MLADPPVRQPIVNAQTGGVITRMWWDWFIRLRGLVVNEFSRSVCIPIHASDEAVEVAVGTMFFVVTADLDGRKISAVSAMVHDLGVDGQTKIQLRRRRAGVEADVLSTPTTITDEQFSADGVVDEDYEAVETGDQLFIDVDAVHTTTAPNGLSVVVTFI